jgi:hypothetical protein
MLVVSAMCFADTEFGGAEQVYEGCKNICIATNRAPSDAGHYDGLVDLSRRTVASTFTEALRPILVFQTAQDRLSIGPDGFLFL